MQHIDKYLLSMILTQLWLEMLSVLDLVVVSEVSGVDNLVMMLVKYD